MTFDYVLGLKHKKKLGAQASSFFYLLMCAVELGNISFFLNNISFVQLGNISFFRLYNCILAASKLYPEVLDYAVFGHQGDESGHKLVLQALGAHPILQSAVKMINDMDTFADVAVTKYF